MIKENIPVIREKGGELNNALGSAMQFLDVFLEASSFVTLTNAQIAQKILEFETLKTNYITAKNSFEDSVSATTPL